MQRIRFEHAWTPAGWQRDLELAVDADGRFRAPSSSDPAPVRTIRGPVVPGVPNLHGHAFQRAFAGRAERRAAVGEDSFWTWREQMYAVAGRIGPDEVEAVAALVQMEMLEAGFTSAAEFHYLHHAPDGERYAALDELGARIVAAAGATGIGLTLLPVLYRQGGFGRPLQAGQRRFASRDRDEFLMLADALRDRVRGSRHRVGIAPHSLRAVAPDDLLAAWSATRAADPTAPVHLHVAEQRAEVEDCVAALGARPVAWLLDRAPIDRHTCLVHATHVDIAECERLAASGAVAGLCPTTEANLGDGVFPAARYLERGGRLGVGTDSHVTIDVAEELRLLEYGQRLTHERRALCALPGGSVGERLFAAALVGGAAALDQPVGALAPGHHADFVRLDAEAPRLVGHGPQSWLDAWLFSNSGRSPVADVWVGGRHLVAAGRHVARDAIVARFAVAMRRLWSEP